MQAPKDIKEHSASPLLPGQDLRRSLSGPSPSLTASGMWGAQQPLEFAWVDPGHGMEAEACGCSGRNRSPGKTSVSPSKTTWPSLTPLSFMVGTLLTLRTTTRFLGVGSVAAAGLLSVQTVPGLFTQPLPGLQVREPLFGNQGLLTSSLQDGGAMAG